MTNVIKFYDYLLIHESKRVSSSYILPKSIYLLNASDSMLIYFDVFRKKKFI